MPQNARGGGARDGGGQAVCRVAEPPDGPARLGNGEMLEHQLTR
jgi:hypothetical protein